MKATILVRKYIESILFYFENPQLVTEDILILKLKEIILLLLQTGDSPRVIEILTNLFSEKIFSFKEVIEAHICSHLTIQELVTLTHHSLSSFKRKFKQIYSDTPANYLRARRLEKARQLLSISDQ
jgi:transcriptional regulator GlxA family with amidase domain